MPEWKFDSIGNVLLTFENGKTLYMQGDDVEAFFEGEGISEDDQAWGEGEFNDWSDYASLAE